jgi:hypothetical protein
MNFLVFNFQALLEIDTHTVLYIQFHFRSRIHKRDLFTSISRIERNLKTYPCKSLFLAQPFGLIRSLRPSVRIRDNSRTKGVREFKFCMHTTYTKLTFVSKVGPNRVTRRPAGILSTVNATRFKSVA